MAIFGRSLEHIFDKPLPKTPTFLESLKSIQNSSFMEIFGELHFKENDQSTSSSSSSFSTFGPGLNPFLRDKDGIFSSILHQEKTQHRQSESFSSKNSESLSMCTEGLGFESCDDMDDLLSNEAYNTREVKTRRQSKRSRTSKQEFPPPISCIGSNGRPWVCFKSFREDGRVVLKEIRIPTQEFLHASRENGCLKLHFVQSDDEIFEDEDCIEENNEGLRKIDNIDDEHE